MIELDRSMVRAQRQALPLPDSMSMKFSKNIACFYYHQSDYINFCIKRHDRQ